MRATPAEPASGHTHICALKFEIVDVKKGLVKRDHQNNFMARLI